MSDKKELLSQLKIDREEPGKTALAKPVLISTALVILLSAGYVGYQTFIEPEGTTTARNVSQATPAPSSDADFAAVKKANESTSPPSSSSESANPEGAARIARIQQDTDTILDASGYITARRMATVSAELTGLITDVLVEEGMHVEAGQVLARLDDALAQVNLKLAKAQVDVAEARIESAKAQLREAEKVLARVSRLNTSDFSSEARLTNSELNVATSKADLARAKADVEVARLEVARQQERLNDHTIRAPFAGVVTIKNAQPGEIVAPGSAGGGFTRTGICTIVDMASLEIEVDVNEAFIGRVFAGQKVRANLDAYPDWDIPARVIAIIPTANRDKATVRVRIGLESDDTRILPDMGVKVSFYREQA